MTTTKGWIIKDKITMRLYAEDVFAMDHLCKSFVKNDILIDDPAIANFGLNIPGTKTRIDVDFEYDYDVDDIFVILNITAVCMSKEACKLFWHNLRKTQKLIAKWNVKGNKSRKWRADYEYRKEANFVHGAKSYATVQADEWLRKKRVDRSYADFKERSKSNEAVK